MAASGGMREPPDGRAGTPATKVTTHADDERSDDRACVEMTRPLAGTAKPRAVNPALRPAPMRDAETEADDRRDHADDERLGHRREEDLAAAGADRPQQRRLTAALRDDDREGVEMLNVATSRATPAKITSERAEHVEELGADVVGLLLR